MRKKKNRQAPVQEEEGTIRIEPAPVFTRSRPDVTQERHLPLIKHERCQIIIPISNNKIRK
ncbi:MAG: hypothetical protein B7X91_06595 [Hydrogenophilales bacterium 17-64-11]|nr:MAG: hypothetical protein B7X91_06595 [Hydrogenophilales bacterium 17-64-11]